MSLRAFLSHKSILLLWLICLAGHVFDTPVLKAYTRAGFSASLLIRIFIELRPRC